MNPAMRFFLATLAALSLAACGGDAARNGADTTAAGMDAGTGPNTAGSGTVAIRVEGARLPGEHAASGEVLCFSTGTEWGASYSDLSVTDPGRLSGVLALIDDVPAQGGRTEAFNLSATWGDPMAEQQPGAMLEVDTRQQPAGGAGVATVERSGDAVTLRMDARRPDGSALTATIRCTAS